MRCERIAARIGCKSVNGYVLHKGNLWVAFCLVEIILLQGCSNNSSPQFNSASAPDVLGQSMNQLAGPNPVDCGSINPFIKFYRLAADAYAVKAFEAKKSFHLMYEVQLSREDFTYEGVVGTNKGRVYFLKNAQMEGAPSPMFKHLCKHPSIVIINGGKRITCLEKRNLTH